LPKGGKAFLPNKPQLSAAFPKKRHVGRISRRALGSLENAGNFFPQRIVQDMPENIETHLPLSEMGMTILGASQGVLAVVAVPAPDPFGTDFSIQGTHERRVPPKRSYIEPCREEMAGIQAEAYPGMPLDPFQYIKKMFQFISQNAPLPRHGFQKNPNVQTPGGVQNLFEAFRNPGQSLGFSAFPMASGVQNEIFYSQGVTTQKLIFQSFPASAPKILFRSRKIDEIRSVSHHAPDRAFSPSLDESHLLSRSERRCLPLELVLRKNLNSLAIKGLASFESPVEPPRNRYVNTNQRHGWWVSFSLIFYSETGSSSEKNFSLSGATRIARRF